MWVIERHPVTDDGIEAATGMQRDRHGWGGRSYSHGRLQERTTGRPSYIFISLGTRKFLMGGGMLSLIIWEAVD